MWRRRCTSCVPSARNGEAALRPAVHVVPGADPDKLNTELAFPCVWVAPWSRASGFGPLRNSLVLNAITTDEHLLDDLLAEPTITNLYSGHHRTHYRHPRVPHDGFLADFLMRNRDAFVTEPNAGSADVLRRVATRLV